MNPITVFLTITSLTVGAGLGATGHLYSGVPFVIAAIMIADALKMANIWQKFVILRAGKLLGVKGPGLFLIIPVIDRVVAIIGERIQTTAFSAEEALTKDTVPVNVDAIIFWSVHDAQKPRTRSCQTKSAARLQTGAFLVKSEVRDVAIPVALQDAMSRQAQAEREKQVRVILGSAEDAIAGKFVEAANGWCARREALIECDPSPAVCTILLMIEIFSPGNLALRQEALNLRIFEARLACRTQEHKNKSLKRKT